MRLRRTVCNDSAFMSGCFPGRLICHNLQWFARHAIISLLYTQKGNKMYATREEWLVAAIEETRLHVGLAVGSELPPVIRPACGFTSAGQRGKRIGECWTPDASADGATEILIDPRIDQAREVLAILLHELIHAAGIRGHGKNFLAAARALHLDGPAKSTVPGVNFDSEWGQILSNLGPYPHAKLSAALLQKKKQQTRLLKAYCPTCGYTVRLTQKWVDAGLPYCPTDAEQFVIGE